jgi:ketosteroid isomerase-like protein
MFKTITLIVFVSLMASTALFAQNTNSSTTTERPRTSRRPAAKREQPTETVTPAAPTQAAKPAQSKPVMSATQTPGSAAVLAAFESLLNGIRKSNVKMVTDVYWNSPRLVLFNNNGTVTRGWEQMRKNRESSYPEIKDVKLEVRDVSVTMLGRDGALVTALWTQSQTYKDTPETATGRMTIVFRRFGTDWKAIHLHTSPDKPDPSRVLPSEQPTLALPPPTPPSPTPTPVPSPTPPPPPSPTPKPSPTPPGV